jgi:hypothetical protein
MTRRGHRMTDVEVARVVEMYVINGLTMRDIAARLDRSYGVVNRVLHAEGVPISGRGGYRRMPASVV